MCAFAFNLLITALSVQTVVSGRAFWKRSWLQLPPSLIRRGGAEETDRNFCYDTSVCSHQGGRSYMEDEHFVSQTADFCAVFDGHGGNAVSRYLRQNLYANLCQFAPAPGRSKNEKENNQGDTRNLTNVSPNPSLEDYESALICSLRKVDREVQRVSHWSYQGSTAVAVWLVHDPDGYRTIISANVGDSRAVLSKEKVAKDLTRDHKPNDPFEKLRIEALGGKVVWCGLTNKRGTPIEGTGVYRINGNLALARAIGDRSERPPMTGEPEIRSQPLDETRDEFIVVASDGLWDCMSSQEVVTLIHSLNDLSEGGIEGEKRQTSRSEISALIVQEALKRGSQDNVTVIIIWLNTT